MLRNLEIRTSRIVNTQIAARCVQDLKSRLTQTAGELRINGNKISSDRAVELRLQVVNASYRMSGAKELQKHFHGGFCGHSSLWHPLEVCLKASTDIHYDLNHDR